MKKVIAVNLLIEMGVKHTSKKGGGKGTTERSFFEILVSGLNNYC